MPETHPVNVINPHTGEPEIKQLPADSHEHPRRSAVKQGLQLASIESPTRPSKTTSTDAAIATVATQSEPSNAVRLDDHSIRKLANRIGWQVFFAIIVASIIAPIVFAVVFGLINIGLNTPSYDGSTGSF